MSELVYKVEPKRWPHGSAWARTIWRVVAFDYDPHGRIIASCPTREAAEAARRLLSGECERDMADAQIDRLGRRNAMPISEPMHQALVDRYERGKADGAAQERARVVAWLRETASNVVRDVAPSDAREAEDCTTVTAALCDAANAIEKGEHER